MYKLEFDKGGKHYYKITLSYNLKYLCETKENTELLRVKKNM